MDNDDLFWRQQNSLDLELIQFGANMPQLSSSVYQDQLSRNDLELVSIHTLLHASTIHLHRDLLTVSPPSYHRPFSPPISYPNASPAEPSPVALGVHRKGSTGSISIMVHTEYQTF